MKINEYVSKILKLPKNNITIGIEDSVVFSPDMFYSKDFKTLRASLAKIKQKARSKCSYSFCPSFFSFSFISFLSLLFFPILHLFVSFIHSFFFLSPSLFIISFCFSFPILFFNRYVLLVILEELFSNKMFRIKAPSNAQSTPKCTPKTHKLQ